MLILTRKLGERFVLADGAVTVQVLETRGRQVRLGSAAPPAVSVHRVEPRGTRPGPRAPLVPRKG